MGLLLLFRKLFPLVGFLSFGPISVSDVAGQALLLMTPVFLYTRALLSGLFPPLAALSFLVPHRQQVSDVVGSPLSYR